MYLSVNKRLAINSWFLIQSNYCFKSWNTFFYIRMIPMESKLKQILNPPSCFLFKILLPLFLWYTFFWINALNNPKIETSCTSWRNKSLCQVWKKFSNVVMLLLRNRFFMHTFCRSRVTTLEWKISLHPKFNLDLYHAVIKLCSMVEENSKLFSSYFL